MILKVLNDFQLTEKLFCITMNNASYNKSCLRASSKALLELKGIDWNHEVFHISCLNHVINIRMQDFLNAIKVLNKKAVETNIEE